MIDQGHLDGMAYTIKLFVKGKLNAWRHCALMGSGISKKLILCKEKKNCCFINVIKKASKEY